MAKKELLIIADYSEESILTLEELCEICGIPNELVHDFLSHEIIRPMREDEERFNLMQLRRLKTALRLQHDLEINLAGAAVVLNLLEELEQLRKQIELFEKHYGS